MPLFYSVVTHRVWIALLSLAMLPAAAAGQEEERRPDPGPPPPQQVQPTTPRDATAPEPAAPDSSGMAPARMQMSSPASATPTEMLIGPGDEGDMKVFSMPELTTHFRVEGSGDIYLPLIGKFHIAGLTADAAQTGIEKKYAEGGFLQNPHLTIYIKEYTTQGISIFGEVARPGVYSALNTRRLYASMLSWRDYMSGRPQFRPTACPICVPQVLSLPS